MASAINKKKLEQGEKTQISLAHFLHPVNLSLMKRKRSESSKTTSKSRGGRPAWATEEQLAWLATKLLEFIASRASNAPADFWPTLFADWFGQWPLEDLTPVEVTGGLTQKEKMAHKKAVSAECCVAVRLATHLSVANLELVEKPRPTQRW
jgi:hypothetical protein